MNAQHASGFGFLLFIIAFGRACSAETQAIHTVIGSYIQSIYNDGNNITRTLKGEFEISKGADKFQVRVVHMGSGSTLKMLTTTDYRSVFYSQRFEGPKVEQKGTVMAWARFDQGAMPNNLLQWTVPQVLTLSFLLSSRAAGVVENGELTPGYIPGFVHRRTAEVNSMSPVTLRTSVGANRTSVAFWLIKQGVTLEHFAPHPDLFLLARIEIDAAEHGIPTSVTLEHNHTYAAKAGVSASEPIAKIRFQGASAVPRSTDTFKNTSYDNDVPTVVNDTRLGPKHGYTLPVGAEAPFEKAGNFQDIRAQAAVAAAVVSAKVKKTRFLWCLIGMSLIPLWLFFRKAESINTA